jgi:hypothetical protein
MAMPLAKGLRGASWHSPSGTWQARIGVGGVTRHLGYFKTEDEAAEAYAKAKGAAKPRAKARRLAPVAQGRGEAWNRLPEHILDLMVCRAYRTDICYVDEWERHPCFEYINRISRECFIPLFSASELVLILEITMLQFRFPEHDVQNEGVALCKRLVEKMRALGVCDEVNIGKIVDAAQGFRDKIPHSEKMSADAAIDYVAAQQFV